MNRWFRLVLIGLALCFGAACGTTQAKQPSSQATRLLTPALSPAGGEAEEPSVSPGKVATTNAPPAGRHFQKWNPIWWFGNVDDPEPPDWYRPASRCRSVLWQLRNPLHNFTFYVIGIADKPFTRTGTFPNAVFAPDGGWNRAVARHKCVRLPFVSFNGKWCRFYAGWRERGNFGCKVNFGKLETSDRRPQTSDPQSKSSDAVSPARSK